MIAFAFATVTVLFVAFALFCVVGLLLFTVPRVVDAIARSLGRR